MATTSTCVQCGVPSCSLNYNQPRNNWKKSRVESWTSRYTRVVRCVSNDDAISGAAGGIGIADFIGGDLVKLDLGRWLSDVEQHKSIAIYTPHEGG